MCIAILKPEGEILTKDTLKTCFNNNQDGSGFMFAKDGELIMERRDDQLYKSPFEKI
jgi:hypothetical protein